MGEIYLSYSFLHFPQDNIPDSVIKMLQPYIDNEEFQPASIGKVSRACTSICLWVRAMHGYHFVAKTVEPIRVRTYITLLPPVVQKSVLQPLANIFNVTCKFYVLP